MLRRVFGVDGASPGDRGDADDAAGPSGPRYHALAPETVRSTSLTSAEGWMTRKGVGIRTRTGRPRRTSQRKPTSRGFLRLISSPYVGLAPFVSSQRSGLRVGFKGAVEWPSGGERETLGGGTVEVVRDGGKEDGWRVCPGDVEVVGVKDVGGCAADG